MSKRKFLNSDILGLCLAFLVGLSFVLIPAPNSSAQDTVTIDFAVWTYDLETVRSNLDTYEEWMKDTEGIDVEVNLTDFGFGNFDTNITATFMGGGGFDVFYGSDHWLSKWKEAGWIVPAEKHFPQIEKYKEPMNEFTLNSLTFDGQLYGLPYYTNSMNFVYNEAKLEKVGVTEPPSSWDEVIEISRKLKKEGVDDQPITLGLAATSWFEDLFFALSYSKGANFFDDNWNVTFSPDSGPVYETVKMLKEVYDQGLMPQKVFEQDAVDVQQSFKQGNGAFTVVPTYMLAELRIAESSDIREEARLAKIPGTGTTSGFSRAYVMSESAVNGGPDKKLACWKLMEYFGGKTTVKGETGYHVTKRWAVGNGLGFAYDPLWDDSEVQEMFSKMGDVDVLRDQKANAKAKEGMKAPWYAEWISNARPEIQAAIMGGKPIENALQNIINGWNYLKS